MPPAPVISPRRASMTSRAGRSRAFGSSSTARRLSTRPGCRSRRGPRRQPPWQARYSTVMSQENVEVVRGIWEADRRRDWDAVYAAFDEVRFEFGEVAHDGDVVIVTYDIHARGRGSGVEVRQPVTLVWWLTGGKVVRISAYLTRSEALETA